MRILCDCVRSKCTDRVNELNKRRRRVLLDIAIHPSFEYLGFSVLVTIAVSFVVVVYISILAVCFLLMRR